MRRVITACLLVLIAPMIWAAAATQPHSMGDIVSPHKGDPCSACRMVAYRHVQRGLTPDAQKKRFAIMDACIHCDVNKLAKLISTGPRGFDFGWNHDKKPAPFWKKREATGHRTLGKIVSTLHLPYVHQGHLFLWPSAAGDNPQDKDWDALSDMYGPHDIILFQKYQGFSGMRIGIVDDGDWIYAIEGN